MIKKQFSIYFILLGSILPSEQVPLTTPVSYKMIDKNSKNLTSAVMAATNKILGDYEALYPPNGKNQGEKKHLFELVEELPRRTMGGRRYNQWLFDMIPLNKKCITMMQTLLYTSQDRMSSMERYTRKHSHRVGYRMAIIFNKLYQLLIDIKTMFTVTMTEKNSMRTTPLLNIYFHAAKKAIDITYITEYMILMSQAYNSGDMDRIKEFV